MFKIYKGNILESKYRSRLNSEKEVYVLISSKIPNKNNILEFFDNVGDIVESYKKDISLITESNKILYSTFGLYILHINDPKNVKSWIDILLSIKSNNLVLNFADIDDNLKVDITKNIATRCANLNMLITVM